MPRANQSCRVCGRDTGSPWRGYCPDHADQGRANQKAAASAWMGERWEKKRKAKTA